MKRTLEQAEAKIAALETDLEQLIKVLMTKDKEAAVRFVEMNWPEEYKHYTQRNRSA